MTRKLRDKLRGAGDIRLAFASIAEDILRRHTEDTSLTRLLLFSALAKEKRTRENGNRSCPSVAGVTVGLAGGA